MRLHERSFSTKIFRPKPKIHVEDDGSLIVIATSWGQPDDAQRVVDEVVKYVNSAKSDVEVTSPFEFLADLTDEVNYVRIATSIANEALYRVENKTEYHSGVELIVLYQRGTQLAWSQVGCPSLLIKRRGQSLQPLVMGLDLSAENLDLTHTNPPLPSELLGLNRSCHIHCGHTVVRDGDQLVLYSGSSLAAGLWSKELKIQELSTISQGLIQENPESPFWLGLIEVSNE